MHLQTAPMLPIGARQFRLSGVARLSKQLDTESPPRFPNHMECGGSPPFDERELARALVNASSVPSLPRPP